MDLPGLYAILDASCIANADRMFSAARELAAAGVTLIQYRDKSDNARQMLEKARQLKRVVPPHVKLIMNDRADMVLAAELDGLHIGQNDLSPDAARRIIGTDHWLGVSTH